MSIKNRFKKWIISKIADKPVYQAERDFTVMSARGGSLAEPYPFDVSTYQDVPNKSSWIFACMNAIANYSSRVPLLIYEWKDNKKSEVVNSPFYSLIDKPNPDSNWFEFSYLIYACLSTIGQVYLYKYMPAGKITTELYILLPSLIKIIPDPTQTRRVKAYQFGLPGREIELSPDEVIHIRKPSISQYHYGATPIEPLETDIAVDLNMSQFNLAFFSNNATLGGVIEQVFNEGLEGLRQDQVDTIKRKLELVKGAHNAFKLITLPPNATYKSLYDKLHQDMQFIEGRRFTAQEVISVMGVPPSIINLVFETGAYAKIKEEHIIFWEGTIIPLHKLFTSAITQYVIQPIFSGHFCEYDYSEISALQEDKNAMFDRCVKAINNGFMTLNEARSSVGLEPVNDEQANKLYLPFGLRELGVDPYATLGQEQAPETDSNQKAMETKAMRKMAWEKYYNKTRGLENQVIAEVKKLFSEDAKYFIAQAKKLNKAFMSAIAITKSQYKPLHSKKAIKSAEIIIKKQYDELEAERKAIETRWIDRLVKSVLAHIYKESYLEYEGANNLEMKVFNYMETRANKIVGVVDETFIKVRNVIESGASEGLGTEEVAKNIGNLFDDMSKYRSLRIARTETGTAVNTASYDGAKDSGFESKVWVAVPDSHTRDSHAGLDGEKVGITEVFSNGLQMPNDTNGSPDEVINCRCTVIFE